MTTADARCQDTPTPNDVEHLAAEELHGRMGLVGRPDPQTRGRAARRAG